MEWLRVVRAVGEPVEVRFSEGRGTEDDRVDCASFACSSENTFNLGRFGRGVGKVWEGVQLQTELVVVAAAKRKRNGRRYP